VWKIGKGSVMPRSDFVEVEVTIEKACGGGLYDIKPSDGSTTIQAKLCGQMKKRVLPGDKVKIGVSPYDLTHGLVLRRHR
jgi:translation initiation factor IF-1